INLKQFLEEQSQKVEKDLARVEDSLRSFQEKEQIFGLDGNADLLLQQLSDIESKYYTTLAGINILKERKRYMMDQLSQEEKQLAGNLLSSINDRVFALRTEIAQTEADLVRNASLYGEEHDLVKSNRVKIKKLKDELELQTQQLIARGLAVADPIKYRQAMIDTLLRFEGNEAGLEFRAQEYEKLVSQYNDQLNTLPAKSLHFARLERDRKVLADTYSLMRQKLEEARITQASQLGKVRIIDPAIPPEHRSKPNTKMNLLLGLILGLGLGVGGAFMAEYLDNTVKTAEEIERKHLTILGIIPSIGEGRYVKRKKRKKGDRRAETGRSEKLKVKGEKQGEVNPVSDTANGNGAGAKTVLRRQEVARLQRRLITHEDPKSPVSEAYRSLRTSIIYSSSGEPIKSILVSSPGPGEGKTTTIANLAITYANLGKRTLLIDSDLRRPVLHRVFGVHRDPGITHYLSGETETFDELVQETEIQNLAIVTAGAIPPNPSELLGSERMLKTVARLEQEWDIVLFDSPPLIAVTDAAMVSKEIDRIILVVKSGVTDKNAFNHTLQVLQNVEAPLGGIVLNAVTSKNSYGSYY
ncbi:MAG: polysaccharide biosynthesis tyrosine autokinase, partial [Fidelibacterota bacterium]